LGVVAGGFKFWVVIWDVFGNGECEWQNRSWNVRGGEPQCGIEF
jgi:hypothetical protein